MPRDFYPNLDVTQLEELLLSAQTASVKGAISSVSAAGVSTTRDTAGLKDLDLVMVRLKYSLYLRTGTEDPRYPNPYTERVTRTRADYQHFNA